MGFLGGVLHAIQFWYVTLFELCWCAAAQYAFNLFSHNSPMTDNGYNEEEMKMVKETRKIWGEPDIAVTATCIRVPIMRAHAESINLEFEEGLSEEQARQALFDVCWCFLTAGCCPASLLAAVRSWSSIWSCQLRTGDPGRDSGAGCAPSSSACASVLGAALWKWLVTCAVPM